MSIFPRSYPSVGNSKFLRSLSVKEIFCPYSSIFIPDFILIVMVLDLLNECTIMFHSATLLDLCIGGILSDYIIDYFILLYFIVFN